MQRLSKSLRKFVSAQQDERCFVCPFPLTLGLHLHHLVPRDVQGPDHPLNIIGLCPNHHAVLEYIRRHVAPTEARRHPNWLERVEAALAVTAGFTAEERRLFDCLSEPYPVRLKQAIKDGVPASDHGRLARDIARADAHILVRANEARPVAILGWRIRCGRTEQPPDEAGCRAALEAMKGTVSPVDVEEVIQSHLRNLNLPFDEAWLSDPME